jgi:bifunctional non-homologous end joining protein LigD
MEPAFIQPMQCKPAPALPAGENWTFEIKFDGYRCLAVKNGVKTTLFSRNRKRLNDRFGEVSKAVAELPGDFTIDGEIVALDEQGRPSFQLLQNSGSSRRPIVF